MSKKPTAAAGGKVSVTLKTHHTHAGEEKPPGDVIEVSAVVAQSLAAWGVIEPIAAPAKPQGGEAAQA